MASAPKAQSVARKPVRPRAAQAAGRTPLVMVPGGAVTSTQRNTPSLLGMLTERMDFIAVKQAAAV